MQSNYHLHVIGPPSKRPSQPRMPQKRRHFLPYRLRTNITPFLDVVQQRGQEEMLTPQSGSISTSSGRVRSLHFLILPIPDRYDISCLSNLRQRWARKMPLHRLVPPTLHSQATSGWMTGLLGAAVDAERGCRNGNVECGDVECWPVCGAAPSSHYLATYEKHTVAAEGLLPGRALLSSQGGVLQSCRGSGRVQGPRSRKVSDLRAEQGLRGRDNITTTLLEAGYDSTNPR